MFSIRMAEASDAPELAAIYRPYVTDAATSFELEPPSAAEMAKRIEAVLALAPWLVCVSDDGDLIGYAYASRHRERAAYQWSMDVTVYIRAEQHRGGVGRALYQSLFSLLRMQGFYVAHAGITLPNAASVGLHEALGFRPIGVYPAVGWKLGAWRDVGWWQLPLQERVSNPLPPLSLAEAQALPAWPAALRPPAKPQRRVDAGKIGPGDARYRAVIDRQFNKRFRASPDYVRQVRSTDEVMAAVEEAVHEGRRLAPTSGGHCLEGFVSDPEVRVIVDLSPMKRIYHDAAMGAVAVEAGATVGETVRALHDNWGTVVPLGEYPGVGIGGHVAGGAFGFLCRELGLAADYLHAVEVVTVGEDGRARSVVASRSSPDPSLRDLWWAHTGGGGGNFGVVTRYWFRAPDASGEDPARLLPRAPASITTFQVEWSWSDLDQAAFTRLLRNHGDWSERHSGADSPFTTLWNLVELHRRQFGKIFIRGLSTAGETAEPRIDDFLAAVCEGVSAPAGPRLARTSWLEFALDPFPELFAMPPGGASVKVKDALLKKRLSDRQIAVVHDYLTRGDHDVMGGMFGLASYGGRVNTVAPDATASVQRQAIFDVACNAGWIDPGDAYKNLRWAREFYRALFADSGGVPVPGDIAGGALINHPDVDLADPALNTSGVPWYALYYQGNYPRLQRAKARWDPRDIFHHPLSIRGARHERDQG